MILAEEMRRQNLDADRLVQRDMLVVGEADIPVLLKLPAEGLWRGWLTGIPWEAGNKSKRSS